MMPRKKRIAVFAISVSLIVIVAIGIFIFLYLNTDAFKSNERLFFKYFDENINILDYLRIDENSDLISSPYKSELTGQIQYTENKSTSDENKNSNINKVKLKINSQVDKQSDFYDYDCKVQTFDENDLLEYEILKQDNTNAYRLGGIKQFIELESNSGENTDEKLNYEKLENFMAEMDLKSILNFSDEEKQTLIDNYSKLIKDNISKDEFQKKKDITLKIDDKTYYANSYYVTMDVERYNNLAVKFLEQLKSDEIVLSRIDKIENIVQAKYPDYSSEKTLRDSFISKIESKINDIENNNIGSDTVTITVYENMRSILSTEIKKTDATYSIDFLGNSKFKINLKNTNNMTEKVFTLKNSTENAGNRTAEYKELQDNKILFDMKLEKTSEINNSNSSNSDIGINSNTNAGFNNTNSSDNEDSNNTNSSDDEGSNNTNSSDDEEDSNNTNSNDGENSNNMSSNDDENSNNNTNSNNSANSSISKTLSITILNENYESIINLKNDIEFVDSVKKVKKDNIYKLSEFDEDIKNKIYGVLNENSETMQKNLTSMVTKDDYKKMLENLQIIKTKDIELPETVPVTEVEKSRFNQQFEFFISDDLSKDKITELLAITQKNFSDAKILLTDGNEDDINLDRLKANDSDASNYKKTIAGLVIKIKEDAINDTKYNEAVSCLDELKSDKYSVNVKRDDDGLVNQIIIKMVND